MSSHSWAHIEPVGHKAPIEDRVAVELGQDCPVKHPPPPKDQQTPREAKLMRITPAYPSPPLGELWYFPLRARGEPLKLILHYAGLSYDLRTVEMTEWGELKGTMPGGTLPVFKPDFVATGENAEIIGETVEIAAFLADQSGVAGLLPADEAGVAKAKQQMSLCNEGVLAKSMPLLNFFPKADAAPQLADHSKEAIALLKAKLEPDLVSSGGPYFGGATPSFADFGIWHAVDGLSKLDKEALSKLGTVWAEWYAMIAGLRGVKQYLACRPKGQSGKVGMPGSIIMLDAVDSS